ncbi:hypothetical protein EPUS_06321 [Endocarpon pusillum Z07020]|uniref:Uncharacterized protein n=1 Tax=Endocarpon pusillum (strain Z07020 / HMAS-L-300199) TaxID=1263415 RepID=U1HJ92_ENDPU|nr:uncharacterized protein EPUS_06321 [Endocarpon pusillum Z07020]ERF70280.1 hypothetical protein EPUS_06321 [Endocarpon pusillum Z07020]
MPYRLRRIEYPDSMQSSSLSRGRPQASSKSAGHFDPFDLARRLEAHQVQCKEAYRLHQQKVKQREAAKCLHPEAGEIDMRKPDGSASQAWERTVKKSNAIAKTTSMTGQDSVKADVELLRQSNQSHNARLPRSSSLTSARTASASGASVARERTSLGSAYVTHNISKQILHSPAVGRPHYPLQTTKSGERSQIKPQNFEIHSSNTSLACRRKTRAMDVPNNATRKSDGGLENGIYVPRYAASGLVMTTVQGVTDRNKLSRQFSQGDPFQRGTNHKAMRAIPVNASPVQSKPKVKHCTRQCNSAMLADSSPSTVVDGNTQRCDQELGTGETTKPRLEPVVEEDVLLSRDECREREQRQRRSLRAKISSLMISSQRKPVENASLSEEPLVKPTISRRKSMLIMFR